MIEKLENWSLGDLFPNVVEQAAGPSSRGKKEGGGKVQFARKDGSDRKRKQGGRLPAQAPLDTRIQL